eukprot:gnl/Spiro4/27530_TR13689_c0_g3_i1.p1 gnl/Spiro4/27530_TR13689_c0_g3~~gnl/Spiro4/27530_TR13689_c0_g3_i1.p1  ORF type:complete len:271 (-),score=-31.20 gnl/Spiro4/27530_TR13689_c0_g3_i1:62-874(-)
MKRAAFNELVEKNEEHKRRLVTHLPKFINTHEHEWTFDADSAFTDKRTGLVRAYLLNGILYYGDTMRMVDLSVLDTPPLSRDVWLLVMRRLSNNDVLTMEDVCTLTERVADQIWNERGRAITEMYGPVFDQILAKQEMTYSDFFHSLMDTTWRAEWLPFETMFRLPPGCAEMPCDVIDEPEMFLKTTGERVVIRELYGVLWDKVNRVHAGYALPQKSRNVTFYWGHMNAKAAVSIKSNRGNALIGALMRGNFESPISSWRMYKKTMEELK